LIKKATDENTCPKLCLLLLFPGVLVCQSFIDAQPEELRVLFVGNSYTYGNNLSHIVSILSEGTKTRLINKKSVLPNI
jgi:hypothetical protein